MGTGIKMVLVRERMELSHKTTYLSENGMTESSMGTDQSNPHYQNQFS